MKVLRAGSYRHMPWKNGSGATTEIAVFPENAGLGDFDWRVSMATVASDGPFSSFPDIDRTLCILDGDGLVLDLADQAPERLTAESQPFSFEADISTSATLIGGPVTDFNVMTRRSLVTQSVRKRRTLTRDTFSLSADQTLIFVHRGTMAIRTGIGREVLGSLDAIIVSEAGILAIETAAPVEWYLVEFQTRSLHS